jgi:GntR family transcriptional regulator, transcriptional repressor for pyruvate dehydrogenase complex
VAEGDGRRAVRPIRAPRMADMVAGHLRARIILGELEDGDELPTEAILLEEFPVSRPSLREAFRILETEGLIRIRRGKRGGCIVQRPTPESAAYHLGLVLQSSRVELADLAVAREALEPVCVRQAAEREDRAEVAAELDALIDESEQLLGEGSEFTASLLEFHRALTRSAKNRTLEILVGTLEQVWSRQELLWAKRATAEGEYPSIAAQREAIAAHRRITKRIAAGDADGAARAARKHLEANTMASSAEGTLAPGVDSDGAAAGFVRVIDPPNAMREFQ